jgi:protein-disulfide isomerase
MRNILIVAGGVVAVAAIAAGVYFGTRSAPPGPAPQAVAAAPDKTALLAIQPTDHVLGDPKAPITMIEYASFTCPHCAHFATQVLPEVKKKWIDSGKVKLIYRDFPLDQTALAAAALAHCAGPERYFSMIEVLFETQSNWARADDPIAALKQLGKLGGLSDESMNACFADEKLTNGILQGRLAGQNEYKIGSTPTFIIDGKAYPGSRDVDEFAKLIDPLLDQS